MSKTNHTELSFNRMQALEDPVVQQAVVAQTPAGLQSGHLKMEQAMQALRDALSSARATYRETEEISRPYVVLGHAVPRVSASAHFAACICISNCPVSSSVPVWCLVLQYTALCTS